MIMNNVISQSIREICENVAIVHLLVDSSLNTAVLMEIANLLPTFYLVFK
jgi:hypothetical protein